MPIFKLIQYSENGDKITMESTDIRKVEAFLDSMMLEMGIKPNFDTINEKIESFNKKYYPEIVLHLEVEND